MNLFSKSKSDNVANLPKTLLIEECLVALNTGTVNNAP